jgi:repressor LexA
MTIGDRIRERRKELGLTQGDLAKRMGYKTKSAICKAETVEFNPTTDRVIEFSKALETTPAYLMGWEEHNCQEDNERRLARLTKYAELIPMMNKYIELSERDKQTVSTLIDTLSK